MEDQMEEGNDRKTMWLRTPKASAYKDALHELLLAFLCDVYLNWASKTSDVCIIQKDVRGVDVIPLPEAMKLTFCLGLNRLAYGESVIPLVTVVPIVPFCFGHITVGVA